MPRVHFQHEARHRSAHRALGGRTPRAGYRVPRPEAGFRFPRPEAGYRPGSPAASSRRFSPTA